MTKSGSSIDSKFAARKRKHDGLQLAGLLLWRMGLLLAGATALYHGIKLLLRFVDLPIQLEIGVGLVLAGVSAVAVSFIIERIVDARNEGNLKQP